MNYAAVITIGVMLLSVVWYYIGGKRHYAGPRANLADVHERHTENNILPDLATSGRPESNEDDEKYPVRDL